MFEHELKSGRMGRIEDKKYIKFVRSLPCCVCGNPESVPHHLIGYGFGGMGTKAPDYLTMPLCTDHHTGDVGIHKGGIFKTYQAWEVGYCKTQWQHIALTQMQWMIAGKGK